MVVEFEGGPCPSLLDAVIVTLRSVDEEQRSEATLKSYLQISSIQDVSRLNFSEVEKLSYEML